MRVKLRFRERLRTWLAGRSPIEILSAKKEWYEALEMLKSALSNKIYFGIEYFPLGWYQFESAAIIKKQKMYFTTPNRRLNFDFYPSKISKLGAVSHEELGHPADREEYHSNNLYSFYEESRIFITPDQRANLRVAQLFPDALFEMEVLRIRSNFKVLGGSSQEWKYEHFAAVEMLGRMGTPRRDDISDILKEMYEAGMPVDEYLRRWWVFSLAGLATPPTLNEGIHHGIKKWTELYEADHLLSDYLVGEISNAELNKGLKKLNYKTRIDEDIAGYKSEDCVDLRWIDLEMARENVENSLSYWESKRNSGYKCYEDVRNSLSRILEKIDKKLLK